MEELNPPSVPSLRIFGNKFKNITKLVKQHVNLKQFNKYLTRLCTFPVKVKNDSYENICVKHIACKEEEYITVYMYLKIRKILNNWKTILTYFTYATMKTIFYLLFINLAFLFLFTCRYTCPPSLQKCLMFLFRGQLELRFFKENLSRGSKNFEYS